jgi:hypothetical protein
VLLEALLRQPRGHEPVNNVAHSLWTAIERSTRPVAQPQSTPPTMASDRRSRPAGSVTQLSGLSGQIGGLRVEADAHESAGVARPVVLYCGVYIELLRLHERAQHAADDVWGAAIGPLPALACLAHGREAPRRRRPAHAGHPADLLDQANP